MAKSERTRASAQAPEVQELPAPRPSQAQRERVLRDAHAARIGLEPYPHRIMVVYRLDAEVDEELLRESTLRTILRHEVLRYRFHVSDDGEVQATVRSDVDDIPFARSVVRQPATEALDAELREVFHHPIDLSAGPMLHATLIRHGTGERLLAVVLEHIAADGPTMPQVVETLSATYQRLTDQGGHDELPLDRDFAHYVRLEEEAITDALQDEHELDRYWRNKLWNGSLLPALEPPSGLHEQAPWEAGQIEQSLPSAVVTAFKQSCRAVGVSPYAGLLAVILLSLRPLTPDPRTGVMSTVDLRQLCSGISGAGWMTNLVPIDLNTDDVEDFADACHRVQASLLDAYDRAHLPISWLVSRYEPHRYGRQDNTPPFCFVSYEAPGSTATSMPLPPFARERVQPKLQRAFRGLSLWLMDTEAGLSLTLLHGRARFDDTTARNFAEDITDRVKTISSLGARQAWQHINRPYA